ncbi:hypothetical protein WUBG_04269 [Wuchereria bancrofti]|uniref:Uncharacterized protein n=1 Tax=Wuchereria bancrofti TaxID=6293 RepID=J9FBT4_WUCBA|nr:hypothetical protein WUBG_04269 [Wuchereria bancrofti]
MTKHIQRYETAYSKQVIEKALVECSRTEWNERPVEARHSAPMILSSTYLFIILDMAFATVEDGRVDALWRGNEVLKAKAMTKQKYPLLCALKIIPPAIHIY